MFFIHDDDLGDDVDVLGHEKSLKTCTYSTIRRYLFGVEHWAY